MKRPDYLNAGLSSLRWLLTQQTSASGQFRPVGTEGFHDIRRQPRSLDQQPVEAAATIAASLAAWRAPTRTLNEWKSEAARVSRWNGSSAVMTFSILPVDLETGSCRDGLHPDRANENRGGESSYPTCSDYSVLLAWRGNVSPRINPNPRPAWPDHVALPSQQIIEILLPSSPILNRQALYLQSDASRVTVRPFNLRRSHAISIR